MLPTAIEISGFRSFGQQPIFIGPLKRLNFLVGQNNSGKSNVLRAIAMLSSMRGKEPRLKAKTSDFSPNAENICVYLHFSRRLLKDLFHARGIRNDGRVDSLNEDESFAYPFVMDRNGAVGVPGDGQIDHFQKSLGFTEINFRQLVNQYLGFGGETRAQARHLFTLMGLENYLYNKVLFVPHIRTVHTIKQYVENVDQFIDARHDVVFSGAEMIELLFRLQHPPYDARSDKAKFERITQFLRDITQNESLSLEVPHDKSSILVNMDGKTLPLHNLGTGIEEILIMAAASLGFEDRIVCIEEPELHIHPLLQKKLIRLLNQADNLFLISTHSSSLIDTEIGAIYSVSSANGFSEIINAVSLSETRHALHDLGYRPSDLLQTNSIVWVEGPSDRIYLNKWFSLVDPALKEGIDYSIMFYGGRLLAHLTASEETIGEFIELLKLNRYSSIVIDSDKRSAESEINQTKQRLVRETEANGGVAWVTSGREIENEIPKDIFEASCAEIGRSSAANLDDEFSDRLVRADDVEKQIDKIRLARAVVSRTVSVPTSVANPIQELVNFVKTATLKVV